MPAKSQQQQKFMGMVHAINKGELEPSSVSKSVRDVAKNIKKSDAEDFASTKHSGIPRRVKEQLLTAFKEYANKMAGNKLGGSGSYGYAPQKGLRDDDGYDNVDYNKDMPMDEAFKSEYKGNDGIIWKKGKSRGGVTNFTPYYKGHNIDFGGHNFKTEKELKDFIKNYILSIQLYRKYRNESVNEGKIPQPIQNLINDMIKNKIQRRSVRIKSKSGLERFMKDVKPALKDKLLTIKHNPIDKDELFISLGPKVIKESKGVPQNYMQGRTSDYHTALRGKNRDYSGGTNFKKTNHGQPDLENDDEDQETNHLSVQQTPLKETIFSKDVDDAMKEFGIKKIPIDSVGARILNGLKKEKFINKIDNKTKLLYFYGTIPKGKKYSYASEKKPLSPLVNRFSSDLFSDEIYFTSKVAAYQVAMNIVDMYNNNEEIDSPYYLLKNYFNSFGMDTNSSRTFNSADYQLDQWLKRNKKYEKAMMKESVDEYGQRLDLSFIEDEEARLKGTPEPKDATNRDIDENVKQMTAQILRMKKGEMKPYELPSKTQKFYYKNKKKFDSLKEYSAGSYEYTKGDQYAQNSIDETMIRRAVDLAQELLPKDTWSRYANDGNKNKEFVKSIVRDLAQLLNKFYKSHDVSVRIKEEVLNEIGLWKIDHYTGSNPGTIVPGKMIATIKNDKDKEKKRAVEKDLAGTLNNFWKRWSIPFRIDLSKTQR